MPTGSHKPGFVPWIFAKGKKDKSAKAQYNTSWLSGYNGNPARTSRKGRKNSARAGRWRTVCLGIPAHAALERHAELLRRFGIPARAALERLAEFLWRLVYMPLILNVDPICPSDLR